MPRYFFNTIYMGYNPDDDGTELADDREAWHQAAKTLGEIVRDLDGKFQPGPEWRLEVADEAGSVLFNLRLQAEDCRSDGAQPLVDPSNEAE